ncbi:MAG: tRNA (adenosine(37)-N6)-dimethylallyltransferase MiaA [Acidimicrobiales bacterium]
MATPGDDPSTLQFVVVGPTGAGKSALLHSFAVQYGDISLISIDSMTIYREFSIGTAKPTQEERAEVPYYLVDVISIDKEYSLAQYLDDVRSAKVEIERAGRRAMFVGGTPLYYRGVVDGLVPPPQFQGLRAWLERDEDHALSQEGRYRLLQLVDPEASHQIEPSNARRTIRALEVALGSGGRHSVAGRPFGEHPEVPFYVIGLDLPSDLHLRRLEKRIDAQLAQGWLEEVEDLVSRGIRWSRTAGQAIGYSELREVVLGDCGIDEARDRILSRTRRLAKRQRSWFRRDPRIRWVTDEEEGLALLWNTMAQM